MQVAATTTIARMLGKRCKELGKNYNVRYITTNAEAYKWYVGDIWEAGDNGDWLASSNKFRAIEICYDPNDYACPRYLTTKEIRGIRRAYACDSAEALIDRLVEAIEI